METQNNHYHCPNCGTILEEIKVDEPLRIFYCGFCCCVFILNPNFEKELKELDIKKK